MVNSAFRIESVDEYIANHQSRINWVSLPIHEVLHGDLRLEASVYATEAEKAKLTVMNNKFGVISLAELINTNHCPRFKRVFVDKSDLPIYQPSQIKELNPSPAAYISDKTSTDLDALRVKKGQILMTCSGTVGKVTLVSNTMDNYIFSHDLLRINVKNERDIGYLYTYFLTELGRLIVSANNYGAVIKHIEPSHLLSVPVPNAPLLIRKLCNEKIEESFRLRDLSNNLLEKANKILKEKLSLPSIDELQEEIKSKKQLGFTVSSKDLSNRLEAKYHHPLVKKILIHLEKNAGCIKPLSNHLVSRSILLPSRFKRYYVEPEYGVPFLGGKEILELDPRGDKFLSLKQHGDLIKNQLILKENTILITCSGTIGKVCLVPKHWNGWAASQHLLRVIPLSDKNAGYLYAWLSSEWALPLIRRYTYGAVVFEIDQHHLGDVPVPIIDEENMDLINNLVLEANCLRTKAYDLEQESLNIFNNQVLKN